MARSVDFLGLNAMELNIRFEKYSSYRDDQTDIRSGPGVHILVGDH